MEPKDDEHMNDIATEAMYEKASERRLRCSATRSQDSDDESSMPAFVGRAATAIARVSALAFTVTIVWGVVDTSVSLFR